MKFYEIMLTAYWGEESITAEIVQYRKMRTKLPQNTSTSNQVLYQKQNSGISTA